MYEWQSAHWHWPQITILTVMALNLFVAAAKDGEPRSGKHSFAVSLCGACLSLWIMWSGGFYG
jgi:hypothetical protein